MNTPATGRADAAAAELIVTRVLDAPRRLVWRAWTDPQQVVRWWGPYGFTTTSDEMDVRPGGVWRFVMHGPDGRDYRNRIEFTEVVENERLAYRHAGEEGYEHIRFTNTVTFDDHAGKTKLTLRMIFPSAAERDRVIEEQGALEGGIQTVARLAEHLAGDTPSPDVLTVALPSEREIVLRRVFDAPPELVFEAFSRPEHVRRWWGSRTFEMPVCEMDFRAGGAWRFVQRAPEGGEHPFTGTYKEIDAPRRIVQTFIYDVDGIREHPSVETITFEQRDGRTVLTLHILHDSKVSRDAHMDSGMESGATESMDRLAELLAAIGGPAAAGGER